ncbi:MAG: hypothetical protein MK135_01375 [Polyangiaceae bacterium]|nr:hypothetical protein [Polyangiaceae bacterium]
MGSKRDCLRRADLLGVFFPRSARTIVLRSLLVFLGILGSGCGGTGPAKWPETARKWYERAEHSYAHAELQDAQLASEHALEELPTEPSVRLLAANVALAQLDFEGALKALEGLTGSEAAALRARAYWQNLQIEETANELDSLALDPDYRDEWASEISELAHNGRGRRPYELSGGLVGVTMMLPASGTTWIISLEVNGEPSLAMIATDTAESAIDSKDGEGDWVSLRFGNRIEVSDVPAVGRDLAGISRQVGAPVKMLLGVNLLRRLNATVDFSGQQFVVRTFEPPAPPAATTIMPGYYRGAAMVMPGQFGKGPTAPRAILLVNSSLLFPLALDDAGWEKAGQDPASFAAMPGGGELKHGVVPLLGLGAFEVPRVPGVSGMDLQPIEEKLGVDLDGLAGSGLFASFRMTFAEQGKILWMEDLPPEAIEARRQAAAAAQRRAGDALAGVMGRAPQANSVDSQKAESQEPAAPGKEAQPSAPKASPGQSSPTSGAQ